MSAAKQEARTLSPEVFMAVTLQLGAREVERVDSMRWMLMTAADEFACICQPGTCPHPIAGDYGR